MKIGLFFGTFNPIHVGHLIMANWIQQHEYLDQIWFVVTPHNPHKDKKNLLQDYHRLAMVKIAVENTLNLKVCDVEFSLKQPNYTITTLAKLKELHPNYEFTLIMGEDNLRGLHKWYNYEQILENYKILVYPRNYTIQEIENIDAINQTKIQHKNIKILQDIPLMKISSSQIRNMIQNKKDVRFLLSDPVYQYLDEMNFYK